ncbi:MAG: arginine-tRNA-protein transferase [Candidatus Zambryskibacteria bacterium CG10_big_fil_rev_8_21_14_0_10_42_12]|uniref:Arginine-tRNA-protein transferase n=1 Tax=Candidatus Zambryskibacteria bacterium CG10_big_fil_rev_8_21_14_0_10_42_12 TaxID=1975115 RepID=A0A2H0QV62_9BACT|nr:MAG: arginine-tRNA-protein transferase [Candidatus Zambryskibacteria bacterium CG10_big_fil_rev_8_21_14_0_10_42_12]
MKIFKSEFVHSYTSYSFGYCDYAIYEDGDNLSDIYQQGFLPYTGSSDIKQTLYMARSARVNLEKFSPNSENRRVAKKFDGQLVRSKTPLADFDYTNNQFISFCIEYFAKRHGPHVMPKERFSTILASGFPIFVITYTHKDTQNIVGYALEIDDGIMSHYWYSFYDLIYAYESLGLWIMLDCIREAQSAGKTHYYIGTVYGDKALYKTNFDSLEFWDGNIWNTDIKHLRTISRNDEHHVVDNIDRFKEDKRLF